MQRRNKVKDEGFERSLMVIIHILMLCMFLASCQNNVEKPEETVIPITKQPETERLLYTGNISPKQATVVTSGAEGTLIVMHKHYGDLVKKDDILFTIASPKLMADYKAALLQYIKSKNEFYQAESAKQEAEFLYTKELIAKHEYEAKHSTFYAAQLSLAQAKEALETLMKQMQMDSKDIFSLSIQDIEKVKAAINMHQSYNEIVIKSPADGILLAPMKSEDEQKKWHIGDTCKEGEALAIIHNDGGIAVRIKVSEMAIGKLQVGQSVQVTGPAFEDERLQGSIKQIDHQADVSQQSMPLFNVVIEVPKLTNVQAKKIRIGMTAQIEIALNHPSAIQIPHDAVIEKHGEMKVLRYDPKTKKTTLTLIKAGKSNMTHIGVLEGLKEGDHIVIPDRNATN